MNSSRELIIDAVMSLRIAGLEREAAEKIVRLVVSYPDNLLYKAAEPDSRIKEGTHVGVTERTDGWRAR